MVASIYVRLWEIYGGDTMPKNIEIGWHANKLLQNYVQFFSETLCIYIIILFITFIVCLMDNC